MVDTPNTPPRDFWTELTPEVVRLIWGEAVEIYRAGEHLYLDEEMEQVARKIQEAYAEENPRAGIVAEYLDRLLPDDWDTMDIYARRQWLESGAEGTNQRTTVCTMEVWVEAMGNAPDKLDRYSGKEIRDIMDSLPGWKHQGADRITAKPYGRQRYYKRSQTV